MRRPAARGDYGSGVPRVSAAHLAARRQQILDAAARCFVRNGFHQTSMQRTAERAQATGQISADADPAGIGAALFGLVQGYILQRILLGGIDRQAYVNGIRALLH